MTEPTLEQKRTWAAEMCGLWLDDSAHKIHSSNPPSYRHKDGFRCRVYDWRPDENWQQMGMLIEVMRSKFSVSIHSNYSFHSAYYPWVCIIKDGEKRLAYEGARELPAAVLDAAYGACHG